jgi:nucleolin
MGKQKSSIDVDDDLVSTLATNIIATIQTSDNGKSMNVKELRTSVLAALKLAVDKSSKNGFKLAIKRLEEDGKKVSLSSNGIVKLCKSERSTHTSKKKEKKKRKREQEDIDKDDKDADDNGDNDEDEDVDRKMLKEKKPTFTVEIDDEANSKILEEEDNAASTIDPKDKNKPCKNNPQGITRLFLGNLPFAITEPTLNAHLKDCVTHVKWITDKATGKFYGSAFIEVKCSKDAAMCVSQMNGSMLMGRPLKINYAPVRPGEEGDWPPRSKVITGGKVANASSIGGGGQAGGSGIKAMSAKPEGCCKLFIGNLSYEIDDEAITKFFMTVESELKAVRWLYHIDSGDFKGCGYVDFWNTEACEKAATLNGKTLLGRPIRIDWTE